METKRIPVAPADSIERRIAQVETEQHRRDTDCKRNPATGCCEKCDRPMTHFEGLTYRAL